MRIGERCKKCGYGINQEHGTCACNIADVPDIESAIDHDQQISRKVLLERWLDRCEDDERAEDWYREDPMPMSTITVKEAYDLQLVEQGVKLYARWRTYEEYSYDSQEHPAGRIVRVIEAPNVLGLYEVHTNGMRGSCKPDDTLELPVDGIQAQLLLGAWLKARREMLKERDKRLDAEQQLRDALG